TPLPPISTLFPYTTLFRSADNVHGRRGGGRGAVTVADRGGGADPRAGPADGHPGRSVLLADRGRRRRRRPAAGRGGRAVTGAGRSEEHTSELQSLAYLVCR